MLSRDGRQRRRGRRGRRAAGRRRSRRPRGDRRSVETTKAKAAYDRTDDPVRMYLREMGSGGAAVARGRNRHRQAHRGRPRHHDPRPVRKRPDLRSHHGLARGAGHRPHPAARGHRPRTDLRPRSTPSALPPPAADGEAGRSRADEDAEDGEAKAEGDGEDEDDFDDGAGPTVSAMEGRAARRRHGDPGRHRRRVRRLPQAAGQAGRAAPEGRGPERRGPQGLRDACRRPSSST